MNPEKELLWGPWEGHLDLWFRAWGHRICHVAQYAGLETWAMATDLGHVVMLLA